MSDQRCPATSPDPRFHNHVLGAEPFWCLECNEYAEALGITQRSVPGSGETVRIYGADPSGGLWTGHGEDYANTQSPIVVKVKRDVTREQLVKTLIDLAMAVEQSSFGIHDR